MKDVRHVALAAMIAVVVGTSRESRGGRGSEVQKVIVKRLEVKKV